MSITKILSVTFILSLGLIISGCGSEAPKPNTANTANANAPKANTNSAGNNFGTQTAPVGEKTNDAASLTPVINAYYEALKKKDDAAFRKFYSAAAIKELEAGMKNDGAKTIVAYIDASEPAGDKPFEVRNEKIEGERASAEIKGGAYLTWTKWKFVKENGEWKKVAPSEDLK